MIWMYVVDHLIRHDDTRWTIALNYLISFGGRLTSWQSLLLSATLCWQVGVYFLAEACGTARVTGIAAGCGFAIAAAVGTSALGLVGCSGL
jgi:hypothetical protein